MTEKYMKQRDPDAPAGLACFCPYRDGAIIIGENLVTSEDDPDIECVGEFWRDEKGRLQAYLYESS